ncbi:MAG: type II secretion system protein [Kiritimatiellae bacterium]|nr:type II secretion system protein [Kiritimatiellia bacterium]
MRGLFHKKERQQGRRGFTLVEVVIGITLMAMVLFAMIGGLLSANRLSASASQHYAAFQHARARIEQMRGTNYSALTTNDFPAGQVELGYINGLQRLPVYGYLSNSVASYSSPDRKVVDVSVTWSFRGRGRTQEVRGVIYDKK